MRPVFMSVYEKPRIAYDRGDRFYERHLTYNYKHKIASFGGFDSASCEVVVDRATAEAMYIEYPGRRVAFFCENPMYPIWEGYVDRVEIDTGNVKLGRGLTEMSNTVNVKWFDTTSAPNTKTNTFVTNTVSQAIYGNKNGSYDAGVVFSGGGASMAGQLRDKILALQAYPQISMQSSNSRNFNVKLFFKGFYHTVGWRSFEVTGGIYSAAASASGVIFVYTWYDATYSVPTSINRDVFYSSTDYVNTFVANTSFTIDIESKGGQSHLDKIRKIVDSGGVDGSGNKIDFVWGIEPTNPNLGYRRAYYRPANSEVEYKMKAYGDPSIYGINGQRIEPWDVRPDRVIQLQDVLLDWNGEGADPRVGYITDVSWDANQNYAVWQTKDNRMTSNDGAFQLDRANKRIGTNFGPPQPQLFY